MPYTNEQLINELELTLEKVTSGVPRDPVGLGIRMQALSSYISLGTQMEIANLQKEVGEQTKQLIKWNKILALATVFLAGATFTLVILTYFRYPS